MPDLLLELFSEEIPARMQRAAAADLRRLVTDALVEAGLTYEGARAFVTPRRLALTVHGLNARSADVTEEKKGPRVGAPEKAIEGFLRGAGLASIDLATIESDPKKGDFYVARVTKPGRAAEEIIAEAVPAMIRAFPWPKSMRWGARSAPSDSPFAGNNAEGTASLRWVRPLRSILCTFGPETEEPVVVDFEVAGIAAGNLTYGHRFLQGGAPIAVRRFDDYQPKLEAAKVVLDHDRRQAIIETEAKHLAFAQGLEVVEDKGLLEEVAGLVEWPVVLMGRFDEKFLAIPEEVIRLTIRQNQKCFVVRDPKTGKLTNRFLLTSNIEASDGGKAIVAGNERVIAARLSDARFFWEQDLKVPLEEHAKKLATITFHEKLGSQAERVERIARLARELAPIVGADPDDAERAARLAKADLTTGMVGEFPELQGVMGRYYFLAQNGLSPLATTASGLSSRFGREAETGTRNHGAQSDGSGAYGSRTGADAPSGMTTGGAAEARLLAIADAIRDHYKPQGPNDSVPSEPVSVAVALADKLDTLVGFWAIDEKPTGSKDPYALRRAALGVIRLAVENRLRFRLSGEFEDFAERYLWRHFWAVLADYAGQDPDLLAVRDHLRALERERERVDRIKNWEEAIVILEGGRGGITLHPPTSVNPGWARSWSTAYDLRQFLLDRLKGVLQEKKLRNDLVDAVLATEDDDFVRIVRRVEVLGKFLDSDDGKNLLAGYKRAANILRAEEKKDGEGAFDEVPDAALITSKGESAEKALYDVMQAAEAKAREFVEGEDFEGAMQALAELRPAVDAFFDKVTVNADDPELRKNRLKLLNMLRRATLAVADFSKIAG